jgi:uncharacterized membrane protein YeaQ/YmgE (transglycosylase-associated protein family)
MNLLAWIVLGLVAGAIAKAIYPGHQGGGILGTLLLGVIGAFVGGSLYNLITTGTLALTATGLSIGGVFIAVLGAIIALFVYFRATVRMVALCHFLKLVLKLVFRHHFLAVDFEC